MPQAVEGDVAFKKINDHIVRVCQRTPICRDAEPDRGQCTAKLSRLDAPVSLSTELRQSQHMSSSSESSSDSSEDDFQSLRYGPPMSPSPLAAHPKHQNLELSDGDYASDAPSEVEACLTVQPLTPAPRNWPRSCSSSEDSDPELNCLSGNRTGTSNSTATELKTVPVSQLLNSLFPKMDEPHDNSTVVDKQKEKVLKLEDYVCGARAPGQTQRHLNGAIRAEGKHETLLNELKTTQDEAMQFLRDGSRICTKSTRGETHHGIAQLQQQMVSIQELLEQREREWSQAHGQLQGCMDSLIRENQELRGRIPFTSTSTEVLTRLPENAKEQQKLSKQGPRSPTPAFKNIPDPHKTTSSMWLVSNPTCHASMKGTKDPRPNTPFRMSSAKSRWPEGTQSPITHQISSHVRNDREQINGNPVALQDKSMSMKVKEEIRYPDGKVEQILSSGSRIVTYRNGTKKEISSDGKTAIITFFNGDVKQILGDGKVVYHYHDTRATHTTFPSGLEVLHFANNQIEKHYPDGSRQITFPDGTVKHIFPDGREQSTFPDGTVVKLTETGEKSVDFPNGQREIHTPRYRRRESPDGTARTVYLNGRHDKTHSAGKGLVMNNEIQ
ncbi:hypothetical protein ACEWY4_021779 [Coilia grayii]|uniref:Centromere protein J C-terminal domain-containing protein n=1 Tax=Coilia grayii TaxID=363190 RepID=A0ABD1J5R3_9TELE